MNSERGFTLVELLVVITIIGILAAIAIPQFNTIRGKSFNAKAESMISDLAKVQEIYHTDNETYSNQLTDLAAMGVVDIDGSDVVMNVSTSFSSGMFCDIPLDAPSDQWWGYAYHPRGDTRYCFDSTAGGLSKVDGVDTSCF